MSINSTGDRGSNYITVSYSDSHRGFKYKIIGKDCILNTIFNVLRAHIAWLLMGIEFNIMWMVYRMRKKKSCITWLTPCVRYPRGTR